MPRDPRVDAYIQNARPFARPILKRIRKAVHTGCPDVTETVKWRMPAFEYKGPLACMAAFKAHCSLGFWKASLMNSVPEEAATQAMGQFGRFESLDDVPSESALVSMVREAVALNDAGVRVDRKKASPKPPLQTPPDVLAALRKNKNAIATWTAFPPSHQREYIQWIREAKTDETRARRLETAVGWIAGGKGRNWKDER